jgi:hypothetical protein
MVVSLTAGYPKRKAGSMTLKTPFLLALCCGLALLAAG